MDSRKHIGCLGFTGWYFRLRNHYHHNFVDHVDYNYQDHYHLDHYYLDYDFNYHDWSGTNIENRYGLLVWMAAGHQHDRFDAS